MKFVMSDQLERSDSGSNILAYGPADAGKTTLVATAPSPFLVSIESGTKSLERPALTKALGKMPDPFPVVEITSLPEAEEILEWAKSSDEAKQYKTLCFDSITELAERVLAEEKAKTTNNLRAYGEMGDRIMALLRDMKDAPHNIYVTCQMVRERDERANETLHSPALPGGKLPQKVPYIFDVVLAYRVHSGEDGKVSRALQTHNDGAYEAKDRSGLLEPFEKPDLTTIFNKLSAVKPADSQPARKRPTKRKQNDG